MGADRERLSRVPSTDRKMNAFVRFFLEAPSRSYPTAGEDPRSASLLSSGLERGRDPREPTVRDLSLARWQEEIGRFEKEVTKTRLARRSAPSGSEAWRPALPVFYKRRWKDWPAPGGIFLDGTPGRGAARRSPRGSAPGDSGLRRRGPLDARIAGPGYRVPLGAARPADFADLDCCVRPRGGGRSTARCWTWGSFPPARQPGRAGFSFRWGTLDMRRDPDGGGRRRPRSSGTRGRRTLRTSSSVREERFSRRIARAVVERRNGTHPRLPGWRNWYPRRSRRAWPRDIHRPPGCSRRCGSSLNRELSSLGAFLDAIPRHLSPGGVWR